MIHRVVIAGSLLILSFGVLVLMIAMLVTRSNRNDCVYAALPPTLSITRLNNTNDLKVSWYEAWPNAKCDVTYALTYWIDDGGRAERNTTDPSYTIDSLNLDTCSILYVDLNAISEVGSVNEYYRTEEYVEIPQNLEINITYNDTAEQGLLVIWMRPMELAECDLSYTVDVSAELNSFTVRSNLEVLEIPYDIFCFRVTLNIIASIGKHFAASAYDSFVQGGIIDRVTYSVSPENPRELTVNWNKHFKHELCMLEYHVVYSLDGMDDQSMYTAEPEARFDFEFCTKAMLMISTYGLAQTISGPTTTLDAVQWPSSPIEPVQDVHIEKTFNRVLSVSWNRPTYISQCDIIYTVNAENSATGETAACTGLTGCQISLDNFCPTTEIVIKASSLNDIIIIGVDVTETYFC